MLDTLEHSFVSEKYVAPIAKKSVSPFQAYSQSRMRAAASLPQCKPRGHSRTVPRSGRGNTAPGKEDSREPQKHSLRTSIARVSLAKEGAGPMSRVSGEEEAGIFFANSDCICLFRVGVSVNNVK